MNKKTRKVLLTAFCAVLLVVGTIMGTMAYLTDTTQQVKNTFTVGKVDITLDEAKVAFNEQTGKYEADTTADRVTENSYKVLPGMTFPKDPMITVEKGSEPCYIGAVVTLTVEDIKKTPLWNDQYGFVDLTDFVTGGVADNTPWTAGEGLVFTDSMGNTITQKVTIGEVTTAATETTPAVKNPDVITFTYVIKDVKKAEDTITLFTTLSTAYNADKWTNEAIDALTVTKTENNTTTESFELTVDAYAVQAEGFETAKAALQAAFNTTGENAVTIF